MQHQKQNENDNLQKKITAFFKEVRDEQKIINKPSYKETNEEEDLIAIQDMIEDARIRRKMKTNKFTCDMCDFSSGSTKQIENHKKRTHINENVDTVKTNSEKLMRKCKKCDKCDYKSTSKDSLNRHKETIHEGLKKSISKRIEFNQCDKRFNKKETFTQNKIKAHGEK